jgi:hypothetical protein
MYFSIVPHTACVALMVLLFSVSLSAFQPSMFKKSSVSGARMQLFAQLGRVTMYKKEGCPYCVKARGLLEEKYQLKIDFVDIEHPDQ